MLNIGAQKMKTAKADPAFVEGLYDAVMELTRTPAFYARFAVPDTVDGRFDLMCLMLSLYLFRIQQDSPETAQALFDFAFKNVERGLREAGVGDLGVPKHMKKMLAGFYGRAAAYYEALEQQESEGLSVILARNLYNSDVTPVSAQMAEWVAIAWQYLRQMPLDELKAQPNLLQPLVPPEQDRE